VTGILDWREVLKRSGKTGQSGPEAFGVGLPPKVHDHRFDIFYEKNGVLPPCKRKPGDPYYEPSQWLWNDNQPLRAALMSGWGSDGYISTRIAKGKSDTMRHVFRI